MPPKRQFVTYITPGMSRLQSFHGGTTEFKDRLKSIYKRTGALEARLRAADDLDAKLSADEAIACLDKCQSAVEDQESITNSYTQRLELQSAELRKLHDAITAYESQPSPGLGLDASRARLQKQLEIREQILCQIVIDIDESGMRVLREDNVALRAENSRVTELKDNLQGQVNTLQSQTEHLQEQLSDATEENNKLQEKHTAEMEQLREQHRTRIDQLEAQFDDKNRAHHRATGQHLRQPNDTGNEITAIRNHNSELPHDQQTVELDSSKAAEDLQHNGRQYIMHPKRPSGEMRGPE